MDTRKFSTTMTRRLATLIATGLVIMGCSSTAGTPGNGNSGGDGSGGQGGSGQQPTNQGGADGAGKAGAGGAGQAGAGQAGAGQVGAGGTGQPSLGGAGGAGQGGAAGAGQAGAGGTVPSPSSGFRSPYAVAFSDDSATLAASDSSAGELVVLDPKAGSSLRSAKLSGEPKGLAWSGAGKVMVAEYGAGTVAEVDTTAGSVLRRLDVGPKPTDVALTADRSKVVVPDFALNQVLILDSSTGKTQSTVAVAPYPFAVAVTGSTAVVTHLIASGDATKADAGSSVTLVDIAGGKLIANIKLPIGSTAVRGVSCSPDGKWAYVVHQLGRLNNPVTHLLRGWVWTNALSIIDIANKSVYATTLLDRISEGAANPWGVSVSPDGKTLWVSAAGAHQVLRVDLSTLQQLLAGPIPSGLKGSGKTPTATDRSKAGFTKPLSDVWFDIAADPTKRSLLANDLGALWGAGVLQVIRLAPAQGPRGVAISPDGKQLAVAVYFAGQVGLLDTTSAQVTKYISVGTQPDETWTRQGERLYHDASHTLQGWLSCSSCHPDARTDGLDWNMLNGIPGDPKNTHTMLYSPNTPPVMSMGQRATAAVAITAGFKNIEFVMPDHSWEISVGSYINSLTAEPYNKAGAQKSASAQRGAAVFTKAACDTCHSGRYYTDLKPYDVGTKGLKDEPSETGQYITSPLGELWRTAPYLHDGSAATLKDVLTTKNTGDKHGKTSGLSSSDIDDLVQYLLELDPPVPEHVDVFSTTDSAPPKVVIQGQNPVATTAKSSLDLTDPTLASLDKILFIKRDFIPSDDNGSGGHVCDQYHGFNDQPGGGLYILQGVLSGSPTVTDVLASATCANGPHQGKKLQGGGFLSPDLSYDGKQILFAYTDNSGQRVTWTENTVHHIFKVNVDGTGLTQLTQGSNNDFDPTWLPDGRIVFVSDRRGGFGRCHPRPVPVYTLFVMNADGTGIEPISLHDTNEWQPSVDRNGLLLYTRWDYVDRGSNQVHHPWVTTPDGLDPRAILGNYATRSNVTPRAVMNVRAIPGSNKLVGTAGPHHQQAYGSIVMMDQDIEDDDGMAPYTVITKDAGFPEATVGTDTDMSYATPWPIDEKRFLVVHDPSSNQHGLKKKFDIYLIDGQGNKKLLYSCGDHSCLDPIPLAPRPTPPVIPPSRTATDKTASAEVNVVNVYDSMLPLPTGTVIKALRVVQIYPKSTAITESPRKGHGAVLYNDQNGRGSLGTVPVDDDGSAHFLLPPGKAVFFQALDADGTAVQSMMSSAFAIPGSTRLTCQGCHERRYRALPARSTMPTAFGRAASTLQPEAAGSNPISYPLLIQPILDKNCVSCHGSAKPGDLSKGNYQSDGDRFYASYKNLQSYLAYYEMTPTNGYNYEFGPVVTTPGKFGAKGQSKLYPLLKAGHQGVTLSDADLRSIALWLDLNSDMYSDDVKRDSQASGQAVTPSIQ